MMLHLGKALTMFENQRDHNKVYKMDCETKSLMRLACKYNDDRDYAFANELIAAGLPVGSYNVLDVVRGVWCVCTLKEDYVSFYEIDKEEQADFWYKKMLERETKQNGQA